MAYAIINAGGLNFTSSPLKVESKWTINNRCIAEFFAPQSSQAAQLPRFGETEALRWRIQGKIFRTIDFEPAHDIEVAHAALTQIDTFTQRFWGTYSIIAYDKCTNRFVIFNDPCGQFPLFYRKEKEGNVHFGSDVTDFIRLGNLRAEPSLSFLHAYLALGYGPSNETGWCDLYILRPGYALILQINKEMVFQRIWNPRYAHPHLTPLDIIARLRRVLPAILADEPAIHLELSGGVESTTLAASLLLCGLNDKTIAVTHFDPTRASSNEVEIARKVARKCNLEHTIFPLLSCLPFAPPKSIPIVGRPTSALCFLAQFDSLASTGLPKRNGALLNGHGGDALFLAPPPFGAPIDALSRLDIRRAVTSIWDISRLYRVPLWSSVCAALSEARQHFQGGITQFASDSIIQPYDEPPPSGLYDDVLTHPSLALRPAKRFQIAALQATLDETAIHVAPTYRRTTFPFLTQPIIELAMHYRPEYLFSETHNRLPVRHSAYKASGLENLWRTDKGDTTHSALRGIKTHETHVREICLEGFCGTERLINRSALDKVIKRAILGYPEGIVEIMRIYATETFLRGLSLCTMVKGQISEAPFPLNN